MMMTMMMHPRPPPPMELCRFVVPVVPFLSFCEDGFNAMRCNAALQIPLTLALEGDGCCSSCVCVTVLSRKHSRSY